MKAKLFVCDSEDSYRTVHKMYTNASYEECIAFDIIVEDVDVVCDNFYFGGLVLKYRGAGLRTQREISFSSWQNFLLKFENGEVAELHRVQNVLYRHDDCTANRDVISRFKEDIAIAMAGKLEVVFSEDEDFVV